MEIIYREPNQSVYQQALSMGATPFQATILANRIDGDLVEFVSKYSESGLPSPFSMSEVDAGANRIADAVEKGELIWILSDFDNDGIGGMAVAQHMLTDVLGHPKELIDGQITHRDEDGYGLSMNAIKKMEKRYNKKKPAVLITIDIASSNGKEAAYLSEKYPEMDIVVTDHHHVPEKGFPENICAFINPNKPRDGFEDGTICGASVIWFVLEGVRQILVERELLSPKNDSWSAIPYLASATIADCVSMASPLNRTIVQEGLSYINHSPLAPWSALKNKFCSEPGQQVTEAEMGWKLGPMINSNSRMGGGGQAPLDFFLAKDLGIAKHNLEKMIEVNEARKNVQQNILEEALEKAEEQNDKNAIVVSIEEGVAGVNGIVAARIKEKYGKPTIVLTSIGAGQSTGSARSIEGFSIRAAIFSVRDKLPEGAILKAGGHDAAAGITIRDEFIDQFRELLAKEVDEMLGTEPLVPRHKVDASLMGSQIDVRLLKEISELGPYGQKFESPAFEINGVVVEISDVSKKTHRHKKVFVQTEDGSVAEMLWFNALNEDQTDIDLPVGEGTLVRSVVTLTENRFRGNVSIQCIITEIEESR